MQTAPRSQLELTSTAPAHLLPSLQELTTCLGEERQRHAQAERELAALQAEQARRAVAELVAAGQAARVRWERERGAGSQPLDVLRWLLSSVCQPLSALWSAVACIACGLLRALAAPVCTPRRAAATLAACFLLLVMLAGPRSAPGEQAA